MPFDRRRALALRLGAVLGVALAAAGACRGALLGPRSTTDLEDSGRGYEASSEGAPPPLSEGGDRAPFEWTYILGLGQSLAVGVAGRPVLSVRQPHGHMKLWDRGPDPKFRQDAGTGSLELVPLIEPLRPTFPVDAGYPKYAYPNNVKGETPHTAMANGISARARALGLGEILTIHGVSAEGGRSLARIRRGGTSNAYEAGLYEARALADMARREGKRLGVGALVLTHGEADGDNANYDIELESYIREIREDLSSITGQSSTIPVFLTQQGTVPARLQGAAPRSPATLAQWELSKGGPSGTLGHVICVGPKYAYAYAKDRIHLTAVSYRRLGEKLAEAYVDTVLRRLPFRPLEPEEITASGVDVRVRFHVPYPPLRWDENLPSPHPTPGHPWARGRGFELEDSAGQVPIASATLEGDAVRLVPGRPLGQGAVVRYAMTQDHEGPRGYRGGEGDGRMGQLADSDPFVGEDDEELELEVTRGSALVRGAFATHGPLDLVVAHGLPPRTVIREIAPGGEARLSSPWSGASGAVRARVHSDQSNYAVHFVRPVR